MRKLLFLLALSTMGFQSHAQESTFHANDLVFNAGIGFGTSLYSGRFYSSVLPPVSLSGEYGVQEDFIVEDLTLGVGGYLGFASSEYRTRFGNNEYGWRYNYTVIGLRGALHYPLVDKLDTYGGVMLGYNIFSSKSFGSAPTDFSPASGGLGLSMYLGGRYYFSDNLAGMAEIGWGVAYLNLGVAFKIGGSGSGSVVN